MFRSIEEELVPLCGEFKKTADKSQLYFHSDYLNAVCLAHPESILAPQTVPNGTRLYFVPLEKMDTGHYHCAIFANREDAQRAIDTEKFLMEETPAPNPWKVRKCLFQKNSQGGCFVNSAEFGKRFSKPMPVVGVKGINCLQDPKTVTSAKVTVVFLPLREGVQAVILREGCNQEDSLEELRKIFQGKRPHTLPKTIIDLEEGIPYRCRIKEYVKNGRRKFFANPVGGWFLSPLILPEELAAYKEVLDPVEVEKGQIVIAIPFACNEAGNWLGAAFNESSTEAESSRIIARIIRQRINNRGGETIGDIIANQEVAA